MQTLARRLGAAVPRPWPIRPVAVSLVITELDVGGAERTLVSLATRLDRSRWHPRVIALGPEAELAGPLRDAGIEVVCLDVDPRRPLRAVTRLGRELRRQAPWLVQSFLFHANVAARLAALVAGRPWVIGGIRVAEHRKRWHLQLERLTAPLSLGSVCVSRGVLAFSRDRGGIAAERLTVIPNGIDTGPYDLVGALPRESIGVPAGAHVVACVGRLDVQKGLPFLFDAAEQVVAARPDWHLVMVGDGPERERVHGRVAGSESLSGRVHWLGRRGDVPSILKAADLLVLPSLWEGMPNVVLEAMAARRAVVATDVEGTGELVIPGETGWLVPTGDSRALGQALLAAAEDPGRLRRYGEAGRALVESNYTVQRMVASYEVLWSGILGLEHGRLHAADRSTQPIN